MIFADLFTDGDDDSLPSDHRAQAERHRDRDLNPARDKLGRKIDMLFVVVENRPCRRLKAGLALCFFSSRRASLVRYMSLRKLRAYCGGTLAIAL